MPSRRQFLVVAATTVGLAPVVAWFSQPSVANGSGAGPIFPVQKSADEWRAILGTDRYRILREQGTERAGSSPLDHEMREGIFACAACQQPLFNSDTKFDSGTGWPSFYAPIAGAVGTSVDRSWFLVRTEAHCSRCGGHLGHVFPDGPKPTGLRYCMNGLAMVFLPQAV